MRKQNEMTAMLASGVSLFRLAIPTVGFGLTTIALMVITTEWFIPRYAHKLARDHDDVGGGQAYDVLFMPDRGGALVSAGRFDTRTREMRRMLVLRRDDDGRITESLEADRATWERDAHDPARGRWRLERAKQRSRMRTPEGGLGPQGAVVESYPVVYESDLSPESIQLRQREGWIEFLSLSQLNELEPRDAAEASAIQRTKQSRVTTPIVSMILLLLGLPFFLNRAPASVLSETGKCTLFCGACYIVAFLAQSVRVGDYTALVAWAPIFAFAVLAMVRLDRIRT
jgi:lipopolysaccharide export system permease protein